jgi:hypothetical protein
LRDNPIAIAEGAAGAPRVEARARAFEYLPLVQGSGTSANGWTGLDPLTLIRFDLTAKISATASVMQIRASDNNGSTWGAWFDITTRQEGGFEMIYVNCVTGLAQWVGLRILSSSTAELSDSTNLGRANINAVQFRGDNNTFVDAYAVVGNVVSRGDSL